MITKINAPMKADEFSAIGSILFGNAWKPEFARWIDVNARTIKRYAAGEEEIPLGVAQHVRLLAVMRAASNGVPQIQKLIRDYPPPPVGHAEPVIALSEKPNDAFQRATNDVLIALIQATGMRVQFDRVATTAATTEERAIEAAIGKVAGSA